MLEARAVASACGVLGLLPEPFQGVWIVFAPVAAGRAHARLDVVEPLLETRVRAAHARLGIEVEMAAQVRDREQQVADLGCDRVAASRVRARRSSIDSRHDRVRREGGIELAELLRELRAHASHNRPVEPDRRRA
jgi:hypothetical protein